LVGSKNKWWHGGKKRGGRVSGKILFDADAVLITRGFHGGRLSRKEGYPTKSSLLTKEKNAAHRELFLFEGVGVGM